jgi:hypothetical protein
MKRSTKQHFFAGITGLALVTMLSLTGCKSIAKANQGAFDQISVPDKDWTPVGLVFSKASNKSGTGEEFIYQDLLKEAQKLNADGIVNVTIDCKTTGTSFLCFTWDKAETWYGSALAIKYTDTLQYSSKVSTTVNRDDKGNITDTTTTTAYDKQWVGAGGASSDRSSAGSASSANTSLWSKIKSVF